MKEIIKFDAPELQTIEKSKAETIRSTFEPMADMLSTFEENYNLIIAESEKEITQDVTAKAKKLRIDIGRVRIDTEKLRKEQKEEYLRAGKAIDGVANILKWAVTDKENKLKEIEDYFEIQRQKLLEAIQLERVEKLSKYVDDASERNLSGMDEDVWNAYLSTKEKEYNDRIEAEKKAESDRIAREKAEREEHDRIRKENEILKKEADERERIAKIEEANRIKAEKLRIAKEETERKVREEKEIKERAEYEAKIKAERDEKERIQRELEKKAESERKAREEKELKERAEYEAKIKAERDEKERIQMELEKKAESERKAREDEDLRIQSELNKGDVEKVKDLINDIKNIKSKYSFSSKKNKSMYENVAILLDKVINFIEK